ncbi:MAG TPA: diacylglycerol kinase family protein [Bacillota bacterium]|nr:diacylglycerol kinase family protein [Bacillota bacterium]
MSGHKRTIGFSFAWNGIREVYRTERNFRLHLVFALLAITVGWITHLSHLEWAVICLVIGFVLASEMVNSAIEKMMDHLRPEWHPTVKIVKDIAAGVVLIAAITAVIIGLLIFSPKIVAMLS